MRKGYRHSIKIFLAGLVYLLNSQPVMAQGTNYPSGTPVNYVRTWDAVAPEQDGNNLIGRPVKDVKQATQYIDGLGRPLQTVIKQGSMITGQIPTDLVSPIVYDAFGREQYKYLPYAATVGDGAFKANPFTDQPAFYNSSNPSSPVYNQGETFFYGKTNYEPSPLNRVTDTYAPGNSWAGSEANTNAASRRNMQVQYNVNTAIDAVRIWTVTDNTTFGQFGTYTSTPATGYTALYDAGTLFKTTTTDEQKNQVIEFKDKEGKVILKKVQILTTPGIADDGTGRDYTGWLSTYYIYDGLNNLRCVIQPEAVKKMALTSNWDLTAYLDEQCFRYEYDQRNRIIKKKVPGAAAVSMVYDTRDRLVLTQDGNLAAQSKWMYTIYDELNRPVSTGLWTTALSFTQLAANANANPFTSYPVPDGTGSFEELTRSFFNDYTWLNNYGNPLPATYNNMYDTYFQTVSNTNWPYPQSNNQSAQIKAMPTGSRVKIVGTNNYLYTVNFYDDKGRIIQNQSTNITNGIDIATIQYTWAGQPLVTIQQQQTLGSNAQTTVMVSQMTYDDLGRLVKTEKKLSNTLVKVNGVLNAMPVYKTTAQNEYNALGQLKTKKLAPQYNSNAGLETLAYDYNIRGWLLGANRDYAKDGNTNNYFGFDLGYDKSSNNIIGNQTYNTPQYNGNIEGVVWKSKGDGEKRKYDFTYDAANRILTADFNQYNGSSFDKSALVDFSLGNMSYDDNGNIKTMNQMGLKINSSSPIDQLVYTYLPNSNKLQQVTDGANDKNSKLGDFKYDPAAKTATDYSYDVNGNLNIDNNKAITSITYNHLNLPWVITIANKGIITYTYDAAGNKLKKEVLEYPANNLAPTITTTTKYISGLVYESKLITRQQLGGTVTDPASYTDVLQFVPQEEGRIRFKPTTGTTDASFQYDYMLKDHLGNVRMVLTEEQQQDIYPAATLEDNAVTTENTFYTITSGNIQPVPTSVANSSQSYQNNNGISNPANPTPTATSAKMYRLNSSTNSGADKAGLGITLKVMAGDKIDVFGKSYYTQNTSGTSGNSTVPVLSLLQAFLNTPVGAAAAGTHGIVSASDINTASGLGGITDMVTQQNNQSNASINKPRAFINVIFFDEQFKTYTGGFKVSMVGANSTVKDHYADLQNLVAGKNGYVYIYCSNESPVDVFFDNLQVVHTRSAILEETHYYPFGLTMSGISSNAVVGVTNKKKFNKGTELQSNEFSDGNGLELYTTNFRSLDPQIGRFNQIDPLADIFHESTPYSYSYNNPISFNDPLGLLPEFKREKENITGWIDDGKRIYFDPRVHSAADVKKFGLEGTYIGERIVATAEDGTKVWGDENGKLSTKDPGWNTLPEVTVKSQEKIPFMKYPTDPFILKNKFRKNGLIWDTYIAKYDDGDALRFFDDVKSIRQKQLGAPIASFVPMNYWLASVIGALALLSDAQIDNIIDKYNKTGDKKGIKIQIEDMNDPMSGSSISFGIYSLKDKKLLGIIPISYGVPTSY